MGVVKSGCKCRTAELHFVEIWPLSPEHHLTPTLSLLRGGEGDEELRSFSNFARGFGLFCRTIKNPRYKRAGSPTFNRTSDEWRGIGFANATELLALVRGGVDKYGDGHRISLFG